MRHFNFSKSSIIPKAILIVLVFSLFYLLAPQTPSVKAAVCASHNVSGYAWSENIGWISFSCENETPTGSGIDYGIDVNPATGNFDGYAWSENIGWIKFSAFGPYPSNPNHQVILDLITGEVIGWARACTVFVDSCNCGQLCNTLKPDTQTGGWDGWIKIGETGVSDYGVTFNNATGEFEGFAWSDDKIGWISFNHRNCDSGGNGYSDTGNYVNCPEGQTVADYQVTASFSLVPDPPTNLQTKAQGVYYSDPYNVHDNTPDFKWTPDIIQNKYQIQVDNDSGFSSPVWDSGWVTSGASSNITYTGGALSPGGIYYWQVRTESNTHVSLWSETAKFALNRTPIADFTVTRGVSGENVEFTFTSTSVDPDKEEPSGFDPNFSLKGSIANWEWDLDGNGSIDAIGAVVEKIYPIGTESVIVFLWVTDDGWLQDYKGENLTIKQLPQMITESGDIYSKGDIEGKSINFDSAFVIHAGGSITGVSGVEDWQTGHTIIDFPEGAYQKVNVLGKIDWDGLVNCSGNNPCVNKYGYEVETPANSNQLGNVYNPLKNKVYYFDSDLEIKSPPLAPLSFKNSAGTDRANGIILVKGDLVIEKNIVYTNDPLASNFENLASVGWIIKGDLIIDPSVTEIVGAFVVIGKDGVGDCSKTQISSDPPRYTVPANCGQVKTGTNIPDANDFPLIIRGLLFARRFFFQRAVKTLLLTDYAERIIYDHRLFLAPPPGMEDFIKDLPIWQTVAP